MEKGKLVYLPMVYFPSFIETHHFQELQFMIKHCIQQIELVEKNPYNLMVRKQGLANSLRNKIKLVHSVDNLKGDPCSESGISSII